MMNAGVLTEFVRFEACAELRDDLGRRVVEWRAAADVNGRALPVVRAEVKELAGRIVNREGGVMGEQGVRLKMRWRGDVDFRAVRGWRFCVCNHRGEQLGGWYAVSAVTPDRAAGWVVVMGRDVMD